MGEEVDPRVLRAELGTLYALAVGRGAVLLDAREKAGQWLTLHRDNALRAFDEARGGGAHVVNPVRDLLCCALGVRS